jgi:spermidine synthase
MRTDPREGIPQDGATTEVTDAGQDSGAPTSAGTPPTPSQTPGAATAGGTKLPSWLSGLAAAPLPLLILVFVGGIVSLGLEVSGPRLMAPYFGTTNIIWATQIGFTLVGLSIGYFIGGRVADRHPDARLLCTLTTVAALAAGLIPFISRPILSWSVAGFNQVFSGDNAGVGLFAASLIVILLLFTIPTVLLGMVSPFAVRLSVRQVGTTGESAGSLYALSTIGSIIGAFLPVLVLMPAWGVRATIVVLALALLLASLWGLRLRMRAAMILPALLLLALIPLFQQGLNGPLGPLKPEAGLIYEQESAYNYIQVIQGTDGVHFLVLNEGEAIHSIYSPDHVLLGCIYGPCWYSDYLLAAPYFNANFQPGEVKKLAIVGLAGGTIARQYDAAYHLDRIDGAELDPAIIAVGRKYFGLTEPNLHVYYGDGRTFMATTKQTYDVIAVDAFQQPYIPFQLTTVEFFNDIRAHLSSRGVVVMKSGHCGKDRRLNQALVNTLYETGFKSVYTLDMPGSQIDTDLIATVNLTSVDNLRANLANEPSDSLVGTVGPDVVSLAQPAQRDKGGLVFTDDRAPVEQITDSTVLNFANCV